MDSEDDGVFLLMRIEALQNKPPEPTEEKTELTTTKDAGALHNFHVTFTFMGGPIIV